MSLETKPGHHRLTGVKKGSRSVNASKGNENKEGLVVLSRRRALGRAQARVKGHLMTHYQAHVRQVVEDESHLHPL